MKDGRLCILTAGWEVYYIASLERVDFDSVVPSWCLDRTRPRISITKRGNPCVLTKA